MIKYFSEKNLPVALRTTCFHTEMSATEKFQKYYHFLPGWLSCFLLPKVGLFCSTNRKTKDLE